MKTAQAFLLLPLLVIVASSAAVETAALRRGYRGNTGNSYNVLDGRILKKDDDDGGDGDDICLDDTTLFRTCNDRRRRQLQDTVSRRTKKDDEEGLDPPDADRGFTVFSTAVELTVGAPIETSLGDGCDCRLDLEEALIDYLEERFYDNEEIYFFCVAITGFQTVGSATVLETTLTYEVEDDAATASCDSEMLVSCCLAEFLPGIALVGTDAATCGPCNVDTACGFVSRRSDLPNELNRDIRDCAADGGGDVEFLAVESVTGTTDAPSAGPTSGPTLGPTVGPTVGTTSEPTSGPSSQPIPAATPAPTIVVVVETVAPTSSPTFAPTFAPTAVPTDPEALSSSGAPTLLPTVTQTTFNVFPTSSPTMVEVSLSLSMSLSVSL